MKGLAYSLSRWHGITDGTTVGGDVGTVTADTVAITVDTATANRAADCCGVSGNGAGGA